VDRIDRTLGAEASPGRARISDIELRALVAANPTLAAEERRIIDEVFTAGARHVSAVMVPRTDVIYLAADLDVAAAVRAVRDTPHSRFPVIDGSHDDVVGFVHLRDLLMPPESAGAPTVGTLAREVRRIPASKHVLAALSEMRSEGHHLAVVVDEYGGTAGIVTLEDLIEELIGEIHDEYDAVPEPELPSGDRAEQEIDGRIHLADFADRCGIELPPGPYESLGGFMMARLGRMPAIGDEVPADGARLVVTQVDGRRVSRVSVRRSEGPA
jgi:putative hemolysin